MKLLESCLVWCNCNWFSLQTQNPIKAIDEKISWYMENILNLNIGLNAITETFLIQAHILQGCCSGPKEMVRPHNCMIW